MNLIIDITKAEIKTIGGFITLSIPQACLAKRKDDVKHIVEFLSNAIPYHTLKPIIEEVMDCTLTPNPSPGTLEVDEVPPLPPSGVQYVPYVAVPPLPSAPILPQDMIDKAIDKLQEDLEEKRRSTLENRELNEKDDDLFI